MLAKKNWKEDRPYFRLEQHLCAETSLRLRWLMLSPYAEPIRFKAIRLIVASHAAVLTDFENRAALEIYSDIPNRRSVFTGTFAALHRLGIGTDTVNSTQAEHPDYLGGAGTDYGNRAGRAHHP
jgi:hypothetical protein